jgi:hypothetical protein
MVAALLAALLTLSGLVVLPAGAEPAAASSFSGSCKFSGPISPKPPITVVPKPGAHFSYSGTGTCSGTLDGAAVSSTPDAVTFTNVSTVFDTCEFGPDFDLAGRMLIGAGSHRAAFNITINLARLALVGPFVLSTTGKGQALGIATFTPPSTATGVQECGTTGIKLATLGASFNTTSPLIGVADPSATHPTGPRAGKSCVSGAHVVVKLPATRGQRIIRATVYVDGHRVQQLRGRALRSVTLRGLKAGVRTVKVVTRSNRGAIRTVVRRYRICR